MYLHTLASGSTGNCLLFSHNGQHLLLDAGISCRRITTALRALDMEPQSLLGVCVTHEHTDHISGLATLTKQYGLPVLTSPGTGRQLCYRIAAMEDLLSPLSPGGVTDLGPFHIAAFPISHDAAQPMGFTVSAEGRTAAVVTDLGYVSDDVLDGILGADLVVCESNHDVEWLQAGPYPYFLKSRILGEQGHLSNEAGAALARWCVEAGTHTILLAHLSRENNTPARALQTARTTLSAAGIDPDRDITLAVAPRAETSPCYEV